VVLLHEKFFGFSTIGGFRGFDHSENSPIEKVKILDRKFIYLFLCYGFTAGTFPMEQTAYKVPNEWIIDAVNTSVQSEYVWNVTAPSLDRGWTHCGTIDHDKTRYFKSVRRKMLYLTRDGRRVLKDTNDSSADFNTECVPSLREQQHTAIDANGTKAETETYDGVEVKS